MGKTHNKYYQKPRKEFSKKLITIVGVVNLVVILFTLIMVYQTHDLTPLAYLIPTVGAEMAAGTSSYYSKAKVENARKIANQLIEDFADKYGVENITQIISIIERY